MARCSGGIRELNEALQAAGIAMNQAGGLLKVSPDGGLLQSSTLADEVCVRRAASRSCARPVLTVRTLQSSTATDGLSSEVADAFSRTLPQSAYDWP